MLNVSNHFINKYSLILCRKTKRACFQSQSQLYFTYIFTQNKFNKRTHLQHAHVFMFTVLRITRTHTYNYFTSERVHRHVRVRVFVWWKYSINVWFYFLIHIDWKSIMCSSVQKMTIKSSVTRSTIHCRMFICSRLYDNDFYWS